MYVVKNFRVDYFELSNNELVCYDVYIFGVGVVDVDEGFLSGVLGGWLCECCI